MPQSIRVRLGRLRVHPICFVFVHFAEVSNERWASEKSTGFPTIEVQRLLSVIPRSSFREDSRTSLSSLSPQPGVPKRGRAFSCTNCTAEFDRGCRPRGGAGRSAGSPRAGSSTSSAQSSGLQLKSKSIDYVVQMYADFAKSV